MIFIGALFFLVGLILWRFFKNDFKYLQVEKTRKLILISSGKDKVLKTHNKADEENQDRTTSKIVQETHVSKSGSSFPQSENKKEKNETLNDETPMYPQIYNLICIIYYLYTTNILKRPQKSGDAGKSDSVRLLCKENESRRENESRTYSKQSSGHCQDDVLQKVEDNYINGSTKVKCVINQDSLSSFPYRSSNYSSLCSPHFPSLPSSLLTYTEDDTVNYLLESIQSVCNDIRFESLPGENCINNNVLHEKKSLKKIRLSPSINKCVLTQLLRTRKVDQNIVRIEEYAGANINCTENQLDNQNDESRSSGLTPIDMQLRINSLPKNENEDFSREAEKTDSQQTNMSSVRECQHGHKKNNLVSKMQPGTAASTQTMETKLELQMKEALNVKYSCSKYPFYANLSVRINSFRNWPTGKTQAPLDMASAGFFYAGNGDCIRCFFCGGGLSSWDPGDEPWVEHARWFSTCSFVQENCSQDFIDLVLKRTAEIEKQRQQDETGNAHTNISTTILQEKPRILDVSVSETIPIIEENETYRPLITENNSFPTTTMSQSQTRIIEETTFNPSNSSMAIEADDINLTSVFSKIKSNSIASFLEEDEAFRYEWIRLKTFSTWPLTSLFSTAMARGGWVALGEGDKARCYSCHVVHQGWKIGDNPLDFHDRHCKFLQRVSDNIPIVREVSSETNLRAVLMDQERVSESSDIVFKENVTKQKQKENGHITMNLNVTGQIPRPEEERNVVMNLMSKDVGEPFQEERGNPVVESSNPGNVTTNREISEKPPVHNSWYTSGPTTQLVTPMESNPIRKHSPSNPQGHSASGPPTQPASREAQIEALRRDPMGINFDRPKYQSYTFLAVRISSFTDWPTAMTQTPRDMAMAGFFYTGYSDFTRCFFCGGGLRNWEAGDDPWVEHARWFSKCAFVRRNRGQHFIDLVFRRAAEMITERPYTYNISHISTPTHQELNPILKHRSSNPQGRSAAAGSPPLSPGREAQLETLRREQVEINLDRPKYPSYAILAVRISSFTDWPTAMTQTPRDMALAGFFYTGYSDFTRCFFCGEGLRNWEAGDNPWVEHARWFSKCAFVRHNLGQQFTDLVLRRASEMITERPYTYNISHISTPTHQEIESLEPNPILKHRSTNPQGHSAAGSSPPLPPGREAQLEALQRNPVGINLDRPMYPSYATLAVRISSFTEWPTAMTQTPRDMALAGFFYAGYGDYTRCFFCGGGLRNWEAGDDPWVEHARWFSKCAFVRHNRGQQFIDLVLRRAAEMENRPQEEAGNSESISKTSDAAQTLAKEEKIMKSAAVISIKDMGYSEEIIKTAITTIKSRLPRGKHKISASKILDVVLELEASYRTSQIVSGQIEKSPRIVHQAESFQQETESENIINNVRLSDSCTEKTNQFTKETITRRDSNAADSGLGDYGVEPGDTSISYGLESLQRENLHLKESIMCKICVEEKVSIAFLPCGHVACCADCAPAMRKCPICRTIVNKTIKACLVNTI